MKINANEIKNKDVKSMDRESNLMSLAKKLTPFYQKPNL